MKPVLRLIVIFILVALQSRAQQTELILKGKILDETGSPLPYAKVSEMQTKNATLTNQRGVFYLTIPADQTDLRISYIGYLTMDTTLIFNSTGNDTVYASFKMFPALHEFDVVNITSEPYQKVFETTNLNILDYSFFGQNILLIVNSRENYQIRLLDMQEKLLTKQNLNFRPYGFVKDCLGILYIVSDDSLYPVHFDSEQFSFPDAIPVYDYITFIKPCVAANENYFFLEYVSNYGQTIEYFSQRKADDLYLYLRVINDPVVTNDVVSMGLALGEPYPAGVLMGEISERELKDNRVKFQAETFFKNVMTNPVYSPLIKTTNAIYIFDHLADTCFVISHNSELLRQFKIDYHLSPEWAAKLITDESGEKIYALHQLNGIHRISEINLESGELKKSTELSDHTYPEKIKIKDGYVFYLYHPRDNGGFSKLYRVALREN